MKVCNIIMKKPPGSKMTRRERKYCFNKKLWRVYQNHFNDPIVDRTWFHFFGVDGLTKAIEPGESITITLKKENYNQCL